MCFEVHDVPYSSGFSFRLNFYEVVFPMFPSVVLKVCILLRLPWVGNRLGMEVVLDFFSLLLVDTASLCRDPRGEIVYLSTYPASCCFMFQGGNIAI